MVKIGHTDGSVFSTLFEQWLTYPCWGYYKLVASPPHPDAKGESAMTVSAVPVEEDVKPEPVIRNALIAASHIVQAIGDGRIVSVEKLPVQDGEEVKYTITIKKQAAQTPNEPNSRYAGTVT